MLFRKSLMTCQPFSVSLATNFGKYQWLTLGESFSAIARNIVSLDLQSACSSSLALISLIDEEDSLPSGPGAYDQSLKALLTQPAAFESESRVPDDVSE
ncbi:hypothetical protein Tco_0573718 [Tanacetum coccineum]